MRDIHSRIKHKFGLARRTSDNLPWCARRGNRVDLAEVFFEAGFTEGVEIGTRVGRYAEALCKVNPKLHLTCVDPWKAYSGLRQDKQDEYYKQAIERLTPLNISILRKFSMDALANFEAGSLDFVFIDGNHTYDFAALDIIYWSYKIRKGGIMAVHDYYPFRWAGVVQAVNAYTSAHAIIPWYITREREPTAFWVKDYVEDGNPSR